MIFVSSGIVRRRLQAKRSTTREPEARENALDGVARAKKSPTEKVSGHFTEWVEQRSCTRLVDAWPDEAAVPGRVLFLCYADGPAGSIPASPAFAR